MSAGLAQRYLEAARVPASIPLGRFGDGWLLERRKASETILGELSLREQSLPFGEVGWPDYTLLRREGTMAGLHLEHGEVVMEDSRRELRKHLPIWMAARGRVLKTGLGLGCVVRGLLANPAVTHIDVVEIDADIIERCGAEFVGNPRVSLHHADAETWDYGKRSWDFAWHDLHSFDEEHLQVKHCRLMARFLSAVAGGESGRQGAWAFPRPAGRVAKLLGAPK